MNNGVYMSPVAGSVPYDDSVKNLPFNATNVQEAFDSIKVSLSTILYTKNYIDNDSHEYIINLKHQYLIFDDVTIDGFLTIEGTMVLLG